jgi:archaellin
VLPAASRYALEKSKPIIDTGIKSVISAVTGKGSQYLEKLERNPEQIKRMERIFTETAPEEISKLSNQLADVATIDPFAKRALAYSRKSYKILDNAGDNIKIDRNQITNYLNNLSASKIKSTSKVDKFLINEFKEKADDIIQKYPETLNGRDAKRLIQEIDKDTKILLPGRGKQLDKFDSAELKELNKLRSEIDRPLKSQSPEYAESMKPVAEAAELSSLLDRFKVDTFQGRVGDPKLAKTYIDKKLASSKTGLADLRSENETLNKLEKELQRNKYNDIEGIDKLRNLTQTFNDLNLYKELQATGAIGSNLNNRIMGSGAALGSAMAGTPGTIAGTIAGALLSPKMEKEGGRIAQKLMEKSQGIRTQTAIPEATQRGFQIQQGAQRGLLDQFLTENAGEVRRKREMESKLPENRVRK